MTLSATVSDCLEILTRKHAVLPTRHIHRTVMSAMLGENVVLVTFASYAMALDNRLLTRNGETKTGGGLSSSSCF